MTPRTRRLDVSFEVAHLRRPTHRLTVPGRVDADADATWVPDAVLRRLGIRPAKMRRTLELPDGRVVTRSIGFAFLRSGEFETVDEVVFARPGDVVQLGARTLSGFGARIDPRSKRLVPSGPHLAAALARP